AFAQYISPALVEKLAHEPGQLALGGEIRRLSIMFCDMQDFTAISEHMPPMDLTRLVSRFLTPMTEIILAHQGTIDKYIGDCVMAFWNAPVHDNQHAIHAARAALAMQAALRLGDVPLQATIGMNTGECCIGN